MAGKVLNLKDIVVEDQLGTYIANKWVEWNTLRIEKVSSWQEVRQYVYATDTTQTTNSKLPWTNKTTIPKLCQIRDNLYANYMASMFPKRKWLLWEAYDKDSNQRKKKEAIINYMCHVIDQPMFKTEIGKLVQDYIDYGNCFVMPDWVDETVELKDRTQVGYTGPIPKRISPLDMVFNPTASNFSQSPKLVRVLLQMGEVKEMLTRLSTPETATAYEDLWKYLKDVRASLGGFTGELAVQDNYYAMDGFHSFRQYLESDYVELLFFYGDAYDSLSDTFYRNNVFIVADRHKLIHREPNESYLGRPPIFHAGWRPRQDNLWAMGPLDNLVGMQYRLDHVENLKSDVFDLIAFPPLEIKGMVEDFTWGPFEKIHVGDDGSVKPISPDVNVLQYNTEIEYITKMMEEMAGSPKEAMGFRTPGEKTAYEVQRLENAASRIFQAKITQFEEQVLEPLLNAMLELARRKMTSTQFRVFDDELKASSFMELTADDLDGNGRIRPIAARHFAEQSERLQNLNNFFQSAMGQDPAINSHFSGIKTARMLEEILDIEDYEIVLPFVRLAEQADAQRLAHAVEEQVLMEAMTATGMNDDFDTDYAGGMTPPEQGAPIDQGQPPAPPMGAAPQGPGPATAVPAGIPGQPPSA